MTDYYFVKKAYACEKCGVALRAAKKVRWCQDCRITERPRVAKANHLKYARRKRAEMERTAALARRLAS